MYNHFFSLFSNISLLFRRRWLRTILYVVNLIFPPADSIYSFGWLIVWLIVCRCPELAVSRTVFSETECPFVVFLRAPTEGYAVTLIDLGRKTRSLAWIGLANCKRGTSVVRSYGWLLPVFLFTKGGNALIFRLNLPTVNLLLSLAYSIPVVLN